MSSSNTQKSYRYIFCINPGRSASKYLASLFSNHPTVAALHEGKPVLNGRPMRNWLSGNHNTMQKALPSKLHAIKTTLEGKKVYLETNNSFIKGFGQELMLHLPHNEVAILVINREPDDIANSFYRIDCHPLNVRGYRWLICPSLSGINKVSLPSFIWYQLARVFNKGFSLANNYLFAKKLADPFREYKLSLLRNYISKGQQLTELFFEEYPSIARFNLNLANINDPEYIENLCENLGIAFTPEMNEKIGVKVNQRLPK